jgi:hypothetical protein
LVARALARAPALPTVEGVPILSKPASVQANLRLSIVDVLVLGPSGKHAFFRLPLRKAASSPGSKGMMEANFVTASVVLVDSIALVGPLRRPTLSVDILAGSKTAAGGAVVPLAVADALIMGSQEAPPALAVAPLEAGLPLASPACPQPMQLLAGTMKILMHLTRLC